MRSTICSTGKSDCACADDISGATNPIVKNKSGEGMKAAAQRQDMPHHIVAEKRPSEPVRGRTGLTKPRQLQHGFSDLETAITRIRD